LRGYGVGTNILNFLQTIWYMDAMIPKQAGFFGRTFGRILERNDSANRTLKWARISWGSIGKILAKKRANMRSINSIFKAIIHYSGSTFIWSRVVGSKYRNATEIRILPPHMHMIHYRTT
jgi:hypothetical protein